MYNESSEDILERMLDKVPNDLDKSEGSFFYDAFSPVSEELAQSKMQLDEVIKRVFAISSAKNGYSEDLEKKCIEFGIYRKDGTKATGQVVFTGADNTVVPIGTIVQTEGALQYKTNIDGVITNGITTINIEAFKIGSNYNLPSNTITELPIQIIGIIGVNNYIPTVDGTEKESDEDLLARLLLKTRAPATSGNKYHYINWATEINGVGNAKVFPLANGPGTVKVVIINSNRHGASTDLINAVSAHIEENRPIGATVSVTSAIEKTINITSKLILANGFNISQVQQEFIKLLDKYLKDIAFKLTYISIARIGNLLLNTPGVIDYADLKINNSTANIGLQDEEIPVLGTAELGV